MKTVQRIYNDYRIMPNLQMHQLRVAAVAKIIAENFSEKLDEESIIFACLFHDMGNILKSDLNYFPEFLKPEGLEHWQKVKNEYIEKYGVDEHLATEQIAKEIGLSPSAFVCLKHLGFSNAGKNEIGSSFENKICNYADMRVGPYGVLSLEERTLEGHRRYQGRRHFGSFDSLFQSLKNIEKQIFSKTNIQPDEINDEKIENIIQELKNLPLFQS